MESFDIPININVSAETEQQAEEIVANILRPIMNKPALERNVNNWDFIEFVEEDDEST